MPKQIPGFLFQWLEQQSFFPECLRPECLEMARTARLEQLRSQSTLRVLGDESAFVVWEPDLVEEDTGRKVTSLWTWRASPNELTRLLKCSIRAFPDQTFMIELPVGSQLERCLEELGFSKRRYRLSRRPESHNLDTPRQGRFRLRQGGEFDRAFLCNLATAHVVHTLPPERDEQIKTYTRSILKRFTELDYGPESDYDLLIAEDAASRKALGYILLELEEDGSAFILDLGVRRSHWGQYVAQFLVRATENLLLEHAVDFIHTEISAANRRSFVTACRSLGFQPRIEQWMHL